MAYGTVLETLVLFKLAFTTKGFTRLRRTGNRNQNSRPITVARCNSTQHRQGLSRNRGKFDMSLILPPCDLKTFSFSFMAFRHTRPQLR